MTSPVLTVEDLRVDLPTESGTVRAVRGVTWSLGAGEVLGVVGESGSGKSVSALAMMGLLPRSATITGSVRLGDTELVGARPEAMQAVRGKRISMVFQDPLSALNPVYTVGWQLAEAVRAHQSVSKKAAHDRAVELLETVGIPSPAQRALTYPHEMSGGMRQRVVIAMAIANDPEVLIADEPTTALDATVQAQILETLQVAREATGAAMVLITHDLGVVAGVADRVLVMYAGRPVELGTVDDVFYRTRSPYTAGLLGSVPRLDDDGVLTPIPGAPPSLLSLAPGCPFAPRCAVAIPVCHQVEPALAGSISHQSACHVVGAA